MSDDIKPAEEAAEDQPPVLGLLGLADHFENLADFDVEKGAEIDVEQKPPDKEADGEDAS